MKFLLWSKLLISGLFIFRIVSLFILHFTYDVPLEPTETIVGLVIGAFAFFIFQKTLREIREQRNHSNVRKIDNSNNIKLKRSLSWTMLLLPFGFMGALLALVVSANNEWPIALAIAYFYFSMLAYFIWRMTVFRKKYGVEFLDPIERNQFYEDFLGGKSIYLLVVVNTLIVFLILFFSMHLTGK